MLEALEVTDHQAVQELVVHLMADTGGGGGELDVGI